MRVSPIALSLVMATGALAPACSKTSTPGTKPDGSSGTGGGQATGGSSRGTPGTGGLPGTGGGPRTGGATSAGGGPGTGGNRPADGALAGDGASGDGATCSCSTGKVTWDCYCSVYDCSRTLASFQPDGGLPTTVRAIREYADCGLAVVTTVTGYDPEADHVFDLATGALVGDEQVGDVPIRCPFGDDAAVRGLGAGRYPDASCKASKCILGPLGGPYCGYGGGSGTGGGSGNGGAGGAGGGGGGGTCSCSGGSMTLDCFCSASGIPYACERALSTFTSPGGSPYSTLEEFADCGLVVVTTASSFGMQRSVYDRTTGALVGRRYYSDISERCPFDGTDTGSRTISAGRFPDLSCKQTSCIEGTQMITTPCPRG